MIINPIMSSTTTTKLILDIDVHIILDEEEDVRSLQVDLRLLQAELAQAKINTSHLLLITQLQTNIASLQSNAIIQFNRLNNLDNQINQIKCVMNIIILALILALIVVLH